MEWTSAFTTSRILILTLWESELFWCIMGILGYYLLAKLTRWWVEDNYYKTMYYDEERRQEFYIENLARESTAPDYHKKCREDAEDMGQLIEYSFYLLVVMAVVGLVAIEWYIKNVY